MKIRDIYGDLYLKDIFIVKDRKYYLYDRIDFNDSLRCADVGEDVAHLSMDLEYHKRKDLQTIFAKDPVPRSNDYSLAIKHSSGHKFHLFKQDTGKNHKKSKLLKETDAHLVLGPNTAWFCRSPQRHY